MGADTSEVRRFTVSLVQAQAISKTLVRQVVQKLCADTKADAQAIVPVDTGFLRSSITYETKETRVGATGEVGPTADYGDYVESGTSRMAPQPYMLPAYTRQLAVIDQLAPQIGMPR